MKPIAIHLSHVSKRYIVQKEYPFSIKGVFHRRSYEPFYALRDINFDILAGEKIGIIGTNGSGKTTLLKLIAGITQPSSGVIKTKGKIASLIDLEGGFHPDLTGRQNIVLNGLLLQQTKAEVLGQLKKIIHFADIGKFIDAPITTYSDGMRLRLGFSIAIHSNPDIFVLDEGTSVGDKYFQVKLQQKFLELMKKGKTIINVSHSMDFIQKNCDRIILLNKGKVAAIGKQELLRKYKKNRI